MSIISRIGPTTLSRLENAAKQRFIEADCLTQAEHYLSALYFYGYVAEIVLGSAYYRMRGYTTTDSISMDDIRRTLSRAKFKSRMLNKAHPIDGWAALLIEEGSGLYNRAYENRLKRMLNEKSLTISENWSPELRYRNITLRSNEITEIRKSAEWLLNNSHRL